MEGKGKGRKGKRKKGETGIVVSYFLYTPPSLGNVFRFPPGSGWVWMNGLGRGLAL